MIKLISFDIIRQKGNEKEVVAEISVSTAAELTTTWKEYTFLEPTIAWVVQTGDFYALSNGEWYKQDGSGAYSAGRAVSLSTSPSPSLNVNRPSVFPTDIENITPAVSEEKNEVMPDEEKVIFDTESK